MFIDLPVKVMLSAVSESGFRNYALPELSPAKGFSIRNLTHRVRQAIELPWPKGSTLNALPD